MFHHVPDDLTVKVDDHSHGDRVGKREDHSDEEVVVEGVGEVVEGASC